LASRYIIFDQAFKSSKTTAENAAVPQPVERKDLGGKIWQTGGENSLMKLICAVAQDCAEIARHQTKG